MATQPLINKFLKGVNTDIAEDLLPEQFLSDGHNIKLTNNDSKQGIAQKQEGYIKKLNGYGSNLKPLAATVFNNIIYIVSYNTVDNLVEYGTYPSADVSGIDPETDAVVVVPKVYVYAPLPNYLELALVTAEPSNIYNVAGIGAGDEVSLLTTSTGVNWEVVDVDAGLSVLPSSDTSPSNITISIDDNYTQTAATKLITVRCVGGTRKTTITLYQQLDPWILAVPDVINNVANNGDPTVNSTITTSGETWSLESYDSGIVPVISTGSNGEDLEVTIDDNPGVARALSATVEITSDGTPYQDIITINQLARVPATGSFSVTDMVGASGTDFNISVTYDPGSYGIAWIITKDSGAAVSTFVPDTATAANTSVVATISGAAAETAIYRLVDERSGDILGSPLNVEISNSAVATVQITDIYNVERYQMYVDGEVVSDGGSAVTERGVCWNITGSPTTADDTDIGGTGVGVWTSVVTNLDADTLYYIRAYAINGIGTAYSSQWTQTTAALLNAVQLYDTSSDVEATICAMSGNSTMRYHTGSGVYPETNDDIYEDNEGTIPFDGNVEFWKDVNNNDYYEINDAGRVLDVITCP